MTKQEKMVNTALELVGLCKEMDCEECPFVDRENNEIGRFCYMCDVPLYHWAQMRILDQAKERVGNDGKYLG